VQLCIDKIKNNYQEKINEESKEFDFNVKTANKFLTIGITSSELLLSLIEDILSLSKFESNMFTINKSLFDISELVEEVANLFRPQWEAKNLKFDVEIDKNLQNKVIFSDRWRIKQTLINLLWNAYKFTFKGRILTSVNLQYEPKKTLQFKVEDTGVGMSQEDQGKLFKLFGMLDTTKSINPNGCGIGLTVSKKYIERLGGSIQVKSEIEIGTRLFFEIPYEDEQAARKAEESKQKDEQAWREFSPDANLERMHSSSEMLSANEHKDIESCSFNRINNKNIWLASKRIIWE
jgi:signal transduction histidine kinase